MIRVKRVSALTLVLMVFIINFIMPYQRVKAFVMFAPLAIPIIEGMIAAGATFITVDGAISAYNQYTGQYDNTMAGEWQRMIDGSVDGVITITDNCWQSIRQFVHDNYQVGDNVTLSNGVTQTDYDFYNNQLEESYKGTGPMLIREWPGLTRNVIYMKDTGTITDYGDKYYIVGDFTMYSLDLTTHQVNINTNAQSEGWTNKFAIGTNQLINRIQTMPFSSKGVTGQSILSNMNWDFVNSGTNTRAVKYDQAIQDMTQVQTEVQANYLNKAYPDIQNQQLSSVVNLPTADVPTVSDARPAISLPGTWTGTFPSVGTSGVKSATKISGTMTGTLDDYLTGSWAGSWAYGSAVGVNDLVWTGTLTDAQARTWTGSIATTLSVPAAVAGDMNINPAEELDFRPLQVAGTAFTKAFPFSLPWDIYRSFATLSAQPKAPDFTIAVPDTKLLKGMKFKVDLTIFKDLFAFMRTAELIAFDICLILLTRRLLGGAV